MASYPVVTISHWGEVGPGAIVGIFSPRPGEEKPAICLGSDNNHSGYRAFLPVELRRPERARWGKIGLAIISGAAVRQARIGYRLVSREANTTSKIIAVITVGGQVYGLNGDEFPGRILARGLVLEGDSLYRPGEQLVALIPDGALFKVAFDASEFFYRVFQGEIQMIPPQVM